MEMQQICVKLWCEVPGGSGNCKTAEMPAADGTPCGDNKVIIDVLLAIPDGFFKTNFRHFAWPCTSNFNEAQKTFYNTIEIYRCYILLWDG